MEQQTQQPRQTAYIVQVNDLINGIFVKEDGWNPNYIVIGNKNVSRVNIIGAVIDNRTEENMQSIVIDDGTGKITIKNFEKKIDVGIGNVILVVGRIRQFGNEKYITPEVIRKDIDTRWNFLWKKYALKNENVVSVKRVEEEKIEENTENDIEKVLSKIKDLDDGGGASYAEIIKIADESTISHLLQQGEIFELKPGRLKVLD